MESEKITRKNRIDSRLRSVLSGWQIVPWSKQSDTSALSGHAVEEYPTQTGPADYAMFVHGKLIGIIEAKKLTVGAENVLEQAKRYSKSVDKTIGQWRRYKIPFLYSTNGELIFYIDVRKKENTAYPISDFHSPQALWDKFCQDTDQSEKWFLENSVEQIVRLRYYQVEAIKAIEQALCSGKRTMLLAMATGTGKTFTMVSLMYRLLKSGYAKRILFMVDRRALAAQAAAAVSAFQTPDGLKLDKAYEVYSQKFNKEELEENLKFNPSLLPNEYLTNPKEKHTYIYVATIQRMAINLLGVPGFDEFEYETDASKLDIPIHAFDIIVADECHRGYSASEVGVWKQVIEYFDAVKIGLTATPASHTMAMFKHKVYSYSAEQAALDGFLVDYDAVKITSDIKINGAFLKPGELVGEIDTETGQERLDRLEDEREFSAGDIETKITAPDSTEKIIRAIKTYTDAHEQKYHRFPKTLIFAVNDLPHISHADEIVRTCKEVFGRGDDFVLKITGTVDRPLEKIRRFRNRPEPRIVVTVDMLTTGVDIPEIEFVVFMRMVKSRILWVQMIGRGARLCDDIRKEKFTIVDCFGGSLIEYFKNTTDFDVKIQKESLSIAEIVERIDDNRDREYHIKILIKRLRRIEKTMGKEAREQFSAFIKDGDIKTFADTLRNNLKNNFTDTMKLLNTKEFQDLLVSYIRPKAVFFKGYDIVDTVETEVMFRSGDGYQKPEDYLKSFERFVKENPEQISAIEILLKRPKKWNPNVLEELRADLKRSYFDEKDLRKAHGYVYHKPLADIISMIKHAADFQVPILTAAERIHRVMEKFTKEKPFTPEQLEWLSYIQEHLIENMAIVEDDFTSMPVFERHGGLGKVKKVFNDLNGLIGELNERIAA